ncbi:zinc ribbon domain-containing protein [Patescibacteria group bacterium]
MDFENQDSQIEEKDEEKEQEMIETGKKLIEEMADGEPISISNLAQGENLKTNIDPGTKFEINQGDINIVLETKHMVGNKLSEDKYLNLVNGELTVADFEYTQGVIDKSIIDFPEDLEDYKKAIALSEEKGEELTDTLRYVKEKHLSDNEEEKVKVCDKCGAENTIGNNFCIKCGNGFRKEEQGNHQGETVEKKSVEKASDSHGNESQGDELAQEKEESIKDFREFLELKSEFPEEEREKIKKETIDAINNAEDDDFVDLALSKGIKRVKEAVKNYEESKLEEVRNKIKNLDNNE